MIEPKEPLSERELDILRLVATGAQNKEIARQLVISPNTVKVHMRNIFAKIGVASRTEATLYALQTGLVDNAAISEPVDSAESENLLSPVALPTAPTAASDAPVTGLPGITLEENPGSLGQAAAPLGERLHGRRIGRPAYWQIGLLLLTAFVLIGAGVIGSRLLVPPAPNPTVASKSVTPTQTITQRWAKKAPLPSPKKGMGAVEYENNFYMIAGETAQGIDGVLLRYDPTKNAWAELAKKPTPVSDVQAALLGEKIYVPGGRLADGSMTDHLEVYNPRQNTWESKAPLPTLLSAYALTAFEGDLYLFGGKNGSQYFSAVYQYDPKLDQWQKLDDMSAPRAYAAAITDGEKIHLIGGFNGKQALTLNEVYFPTRARNGEKPWETLSPLPRGRYGMGIAHLANIIYLLGGMGENGVPASPSGIEYISQTDQWAQYEEPIVPVGAYPALFTSGNYLYTFGGETQQGLSADGESYQAIYTIAMPIQRKDSAP